MSESDRSRTIVITGAGTGIGKASALDLAPGNHIFVHYNQSDGPAREVAEEIEKKGGRASLVQADLSTEAGCRRLFEEVSGAVDSVDVLVNNAGGLIARQPAGEFEWSLMERIFALNTFSALMVSSLFVPLLRKGTDPSIIHLTSIAMRHGAPSAILYGASKGALDSATRGMAKELAPDIRVNAVAPGVIETPFHEKVSTAEMMERFRSNTPLGRNGPAESVSLAIRFLVENDFVTGETIDVNGGLFMR